MHEIALTRRHVAQEGELAEAVRVHVRHVVRSSPFRQIFALRTVYLFALGAVLLEWVSHPLVRLAAAVVAALLASSLMMLAFWSLHRRRVRISREPDHSPGAIAESGVVPGFLRLRGPEDDLITEIVPQAQFVTTGRMMTVGYPPVTYVLHRALLPPEDQALVRQESLFRAVPARAEGDDVPLTSEAAIDGGYSRLAARAAVTHRHRSASWWWGCAGRAVGLSLYLALLSRAFTPLVLVAFVPIAFVGFVAFESWQGWRIGLREHGGWQGSGARVRYGFGARAMRMQVTGFDVVRLYSGFERVRVLPHVIQVLYPDGGFHTIPRAALTAAELDHLVEQVALVGRR